MQQADRLAIGELIRAARGDMSQVQLARAAGLTHPSISRFENGVNQPTASTLGRLATAMGKSADYLLGLTDCPEPAAGLAAELALAQGRVSELEDAGALAAPSRSGARVLPFARPGMTPVPFVQHATIAAGARADDETLLSYVPFRDDWLRRHGLHATHCRVIEVTGESMEPTLEHRAVILVDFQRTVRRHNKIFALRAEDGPVVKRLRHADGQGWRLVSDNDNKDRYPTVPWPKDAVVLGQVMWTGRTL